MSRKILNLLKEMLELVETQRDALLGGRFEEALAMQERRQDIIGNIQNIDSQALSISSNNLPIGRNDQVREDFSQKIRVNIEKILSIDEEIRTIIKKEQSSISSLLDGILKAKIFCSKAIYHRDNDLLNINA